MGREHERERALVVAAVAGVLDKCWPVREGLDDIDWEWVLAKASEMAIAARLWSELARAGALESVPQDRRALLELATQYAAARNSQLFATVVKVGAVLDGAQIRWMPIKGLALACAAPAYGAVRSTSDFDLIVAPGALSAAAEALGRVLAEERVRRDYAGDPLTPHAATQVGAHHVYSYRSDDGVLIELHHAFPMLIEDEITTAIWSRAMPAKMLGRPVLVPCLEDQLGTMCVHAHLQNPNDRVVRLRHVSDAAELIALGADPVLAGKRFDGGARRDVVGRTVRELASARSFSFGREADACEASEALEGTGAFSRAAGYPRGVLNYAHEVCQRFRAAGWSAVFPSRRFLESKFGSQGRHPSLLALNLRRAADVLGRLLRGGR